MLTEVTSALSGLSHKDDDEKALALLPMLSDRMTHHTKRLRTIQYVDGLEGVKRYRDKHPESRSIRIMATTIAYQQKPSGYDDYLANLATLWLMDGEALASTNIADVDRLNAHFATTRFNPAKQFSLPLSKRAKAKIREVFAFRGHPLDTSSISSMSDVRKAAKVMRAGARPEAKPFGKVGIITDDMLVVGHRSHRIERHKNRECIRLTADGITQRIYLAHLNMLLDGLGEDDPLSYSSTEGIGEVVPEPISGFAGPETETLGASSPVYSPASEPLSLRDRIAVLRDVTRPAEQGHSTANAGDPEVDPLAFNSASDI